jgi:hypothetical protein
MAVAVSAGIKRGETSEQASKLIDNNKRLRTTFINLSLNQNGSKTAPAPVPD